MFRHINSQLCIAGCSIDVSLRIVNPGHVVSATPIGHSLGARPPRRALGTTARLHKRTGRQIGVGTGRMAPCLERAIACLFGPCVNSGKWLARLDSNEAAARSAFTLHNQLSILFQLALFWRAATRRRLGA